MTIDPQELEDYNRFLLIEGFPYDDKEALEDLMTIKAFREALGSGESSEYTMTAGGEDDISGGS